MISAKEGRENLFYQGKDTDAGNRKKSWDGSGMAVMIKLLYRRKNAKQPQSDEKEWNGDKKLRGKG